MNESLIAELERAKEGSRELDLKVHKAVGLCDPTARYISTIEGLQWFEHHPEVPGGADECIEEPLPYYTISLDDALTLVPEGFAIEDFMIWPGHPASLTILGTHKDGDKYWHNSSDGRWKGEAATPPLAVSIAALKALENG